jgi:hypothetical protein
MIATASEASFAKQLDDGEVPPIVDNYESSHLFFAIL